MVFSTLWRGSGRVAPGTRTEHEPGAWVWRVSVRNAMLGIRNLASCGRQGTFIRNERAQDLDAMQRHEGLVALGERVVPHTMRCAPSPRHSCPLLPFKSLSCESCAQSLLPLQEWTSGLAGAGRVLQLPTLPQRQPAHPAAAALPQIQRAYEQLHQRRDALLCADPALLPAANGAAAPDDGAPGQALRRSCSSFKCAASLVSTTAASRHSVPACKHNSSFKVLSKSTKDVPNMGRSVFGRLAREQACMSHLSPPRAPRAWVQVHAQVCGGGGRGGAGGGDGGGAGGHGGRAHARAAQRRLRARAAQLGGEAGAAACPLCGHSCWARCAALVVEVKGVTLRITAPWRSTHTACKHEVSLAHG